MNEELLELNPEEIKQLSKVLADTIIKEPQQILTVATYVSECEIEIPSEITEVIDLDLIASSVHGITDILGQISGWFRDLLNSVSSWIVSAIEGFISGIVDTIRNIINTITSSISGFVSTVVSTLSNFISGAVSTIVSTVSSFISSAVSTISGTISSIVSTLQSAISTVVSSISGALQSIGSAIMGAINAVSSALSSVASTISSALSNVASTIGSAISGVASSILNALSGVASTIGNVIRGIATSIMSAISGVASAIGNAISGLASAILNAIGGFASTISSAIGGIVSAVVNAITGAIKTISDVFGAIGKTILDALSGAIKTISDAIGTIAKKFMEGLASISKGITDLWNYLVSSFQDIASKVGAGFTVIGNALMGFINGIIQAGQWIVNALGSIGKWIWEALPDWVEDALTKIKEWMEAFKKAIDEFLKDPVRWIKENIVKAFVLPVPTYLPTAKSTVYVFPSYEGYPVWGQFEAIIRPVYDPLKWIKDTLISVLEDLWGAITSGISWLWKTIVDAVKGIAQTIADAFKGIAKFLSDVLTGFFQSIIGLFTVKGSLKLSPELQPLNDLWHDVYGLVEKETTSVFSNIWITPCQEAIKVYQPLIKIDEVTKNMLGSFAFTATVTTAPLWGSISARILAWVIRGIAGWIYGMELPVRINLRPIGLGVDTTINIAKSIGGAFYEMADNLLKWVDEIGRGLVYGYTIWMSRPIARTFNWMIRNFVPVELPDIEIMLEYTRRMLPHEDISNIMSTFKYFMALYGFSDYIIDSFFKSPKELSIKVKDRFGADREIPLSLVYSLPSASDVATMMVRDIFATIEDFQKIYLATGMEKDVGILYYFLRFRYPPPERLWQFTVRGISGLLWATISDAEIKDIQKELEKIGAYTPVSPIALNTMKEKEIQQLMSAFKTYMKWHDYFRGAWIEGFTSDNLIYIDTLADIPTKIDQRWMVKWGIYQFLSTKKVSYDSPISKFATEILESNKASEIWMDLTNFSRTILATGLHPDWVPTTAVAEAMNALTEERTAIRAGFIGLFKEGFYDISALETLLSGFIKASFQVAYFDSRAMKWTTGWVNIPVMYLPPERRLLELRALMDRSLDILREIQRDISTAYQEFIIADYNEYKTKLTQVINSINEFYAKDYEAITGAKLPDELKLKFVEDYYKPYVEALSIWREAFTIRRVRMWTQRWLGWIMYRVATGVVKKEDVANFAKYVGEQARLTKYESEFISGVLDRLLGIAQREYSPTPSQLATFAEYVVIDSTVIDKVFETRGITGDWALIWRKYIDVRPIADDVRGLITSYRRALLYTTIPKEISEKVIDYAKLIGFTDREFDILALKVQLEELIIQAREYIPTPLQLATLCEYIPEARAFFDQVMKARRISPEWQKFWAKYIDVRPLVDDIKRYLSRAETLYVRFMTKKEDFQKILDEVSDYLGYTSKELEFLMKVTEFERYRNAWTELIGSVERLVDLSEYSPKASKYALGKLYEMIDALPLPQADRQELKEMWEEYIRNRPVKSEAKMYVTQLINLYVDGLISDTDFKKELQAMKKWGFSDDELMFYEAQAGLRRARKLRIPLVYGE